MQAGVLAHGGTFGPDGTFTAPYLFSKWVQIKLAAQRLKEPVLAVIAAVDQVRQAKGQAPAPGPAVAATTGPAAVPTVPTPIATPTISAEQVQQISRCIV